MSRKTIDTITISLGSVTGLALASAPQWLAGSSVELDKIAAYGDAAFTSVPRSVKSYPEAEFTFIDEGDGKADSAEALVGTVVTVSITSKYGDGKATSTGTAKSFDMAIQSCEPGGPVSVDGERKATFVVKATRHAPPSASSGSGTGAQGGAA